MATPGGPRPGNLPPNYNPNAITNNMQNLQINRPNQPPNSGGGPRGPPPPFGQQPRPQSQPQSQPFPSSPFPGPVQQRAPPPGAVPRGAMPPPSGPPQAALPPFMASNRPTGGPPGSNTNHPPPSASRPIAPPGPFANSPATGPPPGGPMSNGPPTFGPGGMQGGPNNPPANIRLRPSAGPPPPGGPPFMGQSMPPATGIQSNNAPPRPVQPAPPFSAPPSGMQPSSRPPPFTGQGIPQPQGSPFGAQPWQMQSRQNIPPGPPPPTSGSPQPPRMFNMQPPPLSNQQAMATISPTMGPTGPSGTGPSRIDPNQIPRPIPTSSILLHETRHGNQANPPPPATSEYIVRDTGNCSPRYMRCTINQIPCTSDLLTTSGMPLALLVQPLALPHPSEEPIQIVDFGESGPVRCSRCKCYINPFMKFIDQGRRFICNLCGFTDETPREYQCNLGPDGRRRDADERPELCRGTVEFVATREFLVREPMPAVFFFLVDVSMNAIQTGATAGACSAISRVIADLPEGPQTLVGIATFDSTIHFYNLKRASQQPLMFLVPDIHEVYTPLPSDCVVQLSECRQHLELLLESIPTMFQNNKTADSAFGAGMKGAFLAMKSTGGKLLVFQSVLPSVGIGALSAREAEGRSNISAGEKDHQGNEVDEVEEVTEINEDNQVHEVEEVNEDPQDKESQEHGDFYTGDVGLDGIKEKKNGSQDHSDLDNDDDSGDSDYWVDEENLIPNVEVDMRDFHMNVDSDAEFFEDNRTEVVDNDKEPQELDVIQNDEWDSLDEDSDLDKKRRAVLKQLGKERQCSLGEGFKACLRDFLGLDGAFMKGPFPGQILTAVGVDSNNGIYPLAYAIVETENTRSWKWFLECLGDDLDLVANSNFTFISDRQKGLIPALAETFPCAEHRYCLRHIYENMRKTWRTKEYKEHLWKCATATTIPEFNHFMKELSIFDKGAYDWVKQIPAKHWARSHFTGRPLTDMLLNNVCEVFNRQLVEGRDKPIISCLEYIREYMMKRICNVMKVQDKCVGPLTPSASKIFEQNTTAAAQYTATWNGSDKYQVQGPWQDQHVVDMGKKVCSCRKWELTGIPCKHVIAVLFEKGDHGEVVGELHTYVHSVHWLETWKAAYAYKVEPIKGRTLWPVSDCPMKINPPPHHNQPGRPKRKRKQSVEERLQSQSQSVGTSGSQSRGGEQVHVHGPGGSGKLTRKFMKVTCSKCKVKGHNARSCKSQGGN
ncbi:hypothetical protein L2E82_39421 [Cichorium intybus]|uniref:Uncharacterized protein n=1 Tax=Cichorium intybus TaxID=13427 RepID=A0ACB9AI72_CICIN|nr:hypothetical protein L2E82_39421 [Cichorium intybus]